MNTDLTITQLPDSTDKRGLSFSLPTEIIEDLAVRDVHIAAVQTGHVRGNHYHAKKSELITVIYMNNWSLHWDTGAGTPVQCREFGGRGAVSIRFPLQWSHAIRNDGEKDLWLFNMTDTPFNSSIPSTSQDVHPRTVI